MITFNELLNKAKAIGKDASVYPCMRKNILLVLLEDFDNSKKVFRDYENPNAVNEFLLYLRENANFISKFYHCYRFNDIIVKVDLASYYDIKKNKKKY